MGVDQKLRFKLEGETSINHSNRNAVIEQPKQNVFKVPSNHRSVKDYFKVQKKPNVPVKPFVDSEKRIEQSQSVRADSTTVMDVPDLIPLYEFQYETPRKQTPKFPSRFLTKPKGIPSPMMIETPIQKKIQAQSNGAIGGFVTANSIFHNNKEETNVRNHVKVVDSQSVGVLDELSELDDEFMDLVFDEFEEMKNTDKECESRNILYTVPPPVDRFDDSISSILGRKCHVKPIDTITDEFEDDDDDDDNSNEQPKQVNQVIGNANTFLAEDEQPPNGDRQRSNGDKQLLKSVKQTPNGDKQTFEILSSDERIKPRIVAMNPPKPIIRKKTVNNYRYMEPARMEHSSQPIRNNYVRPTNSMSFDSPKLERKKLRPSINDLILNGEKQSEDGRGTLRMLPKPRRYLL